MKKAPSSTSGVILLVLVSAGMGAQADPTQKTLGDLNHQERQDLYNYGIMASLAYRGNAPQGAGASAGAPLRPILTDAERTFLERTGYTCLGAKEDPKSGIRVLGFYNKDLHRLVIATRGTYLQDRATMILNVLSDLGISRNFSNTEIIASLQGTLDKLKKEPGHFAPAGLAGNATTRIATAELEAACELLATSARDCVPMRVVGNSAADRAKAAITNGLKQGLNILYGAAAGAAKQGYAYAGVGAAAGAGLGGVAAGVVGGPVGAGAGAVAGGAVAGALAGVAGASVGALKGGYQALADNAKAIGLNVATTGDGYQQTLTSLRVVDQFAREFQDQVNRFPGRSQQVQDIVYTGHSLGGYLSSVVGCIRASRAFSFNGPGVTAAAIGKIAGELHLPDVPDSKAGWDERAARCITSTVLSSDLIGNLGVHDGALITLRNADSPFGRNRDALRWVRHELHAMGRFNNQGAAQNQLEPADRYKRTFATVALEQHSMRHLVRLLESLDTMAGMTLVHAPSRPGGAEPASGDAYLGSPARAHRFQKAIDAQDALALPFAGDALGAAGATRPARGDGKAGAGEERKDSVVPGVRPAWKGPAPAGS